MPQAVLGGAAVMMFFFHRDQRNPAGHKGEDDSEEPDYRFCSAWSWLWNGSEHGNLSSDPAGDPADFGGSGIVPAAVVAILLNIVLPDEKKIDNSRKKIKMLK